MKDEDIKKQILINDIKQVVLEAMAAGINMAELGENNVNDESGRLFKRIEFLMGVK